jgi:hypothetical protein
MTADGFDRLLYTDCQAGTGRGAGGGFQIQAQSVGVDSAQANMAVGWLLYEAQNAWIVQRRPVEDFPQGFAHACEAGFGTAQGRYMGKESTGGRQGNHLADCLLTRDGDRYGPTRPVQLWRSDLWRSEPWATTDCPPFTGEVSPGPLTVDAVVEWLGKQPERLPVLSRLLTVLDDPQGRRVTIVANGPDEAMTWIAAATLLMPMRQALTISFKVFSANLGRAPHRIIAVPREVHPQVAPGRGESSFVLDADDCASDEVEISERARFLAGQLASADDPYDVVDALELAEFLRGDHPDGRHDALLTAWALTRPGDPVGDPDALFSWLSRATVALTAEHGITVASMILRATPSARQLRWIDRAITQRLIDLDAASVRAKLLAAELTEARAATTPPSEPLSPVGLSSEAQRDADSELSSAILLSPFPQVDLLLRLSRRHGINLQLSSPLRQRLEEFVRDWIDHNHRYDPRSWALGNVVLDIAYDELRSRLAQQGVRGIGGPLRRLHPYLIDRVGDASDPLDRHVAAAAIAAAPSDDRPGRVQALVERILKSPTPDIALDHLQEAFLQWDIAGSREIIALLMCLPTSVRIRPEIAKVAVARLEKAADKPSERMLKILSLLDEHRLVPESGPLSRVLTADRDVHAFVERARSPRIAVEPKFFRQTIEVLADAAEIGPDVVRSRLGDVLQACLTCRHPGLGSAVVTSLDSPLPRMLIERWASELSGPDSVRAVLWAANTVNDPELPDRRVRQIATALSQYANELSQADYERWSAQVSRHCRKKQAETFEWLINYEAPKARPRLNLWTRRDGG